MPRIEHTSLYLLYALCYDVSNVVIEQVSKQSTRFHAVQVNYSYNYFVWLLPFDRWSNRSSLLGSSDTIFIFFHLFLLMARPLLCRMVAKKSRVSQNVSAIRFVVCVYPRQTNVFFSFSLFLSRKRTVLLSRRFD